LFYSWICNHVFNYEEMMDRDDFVSGLLGLALGAGVYYLANKQGQKDLLEKAKKERDAETLNNLQDEILELKRKLGSNSIS
jgi:hypothetical protein